MQGYVTTDTGSVPEMTFATEDVYEKFFYPGSTEVGYRLKYHAGQVVPAAELARLAEDNQKPQTAGDKMVVASGVSNPNPDGNVSAGRVTEADALGLTVPGANSRGDGGNKATGPGEEVPPPTTQAEPGTSEASASNGGGDNGGSTDDGKGDGRDQGPTYPAAGLTHPDATDDHQVGDDGQLQNAHGENIEDPNVAAGPGNVAAEAREADAGTGTTGGDTAGDTRSPGGDADDQNGAPGATRKSATEIVGEGNLAVIDWLANASASEKAELLALENERPTPRKTVLKAAMPSTSE